MFVIIGVNTIGTIVSEIIKSQLPSESLFYVDDDDKKKTQVFNEVKVLYDTLELFEEIKKGTAIQISIAFGEKLLSKKRLLYDSLKKSANVSFPVLCDKSAIVSDLATIGEGNILSFGAIVAHNTLLKANSVVWSGAVIEHNCVIGECCYIAPNVTVSGFVEIGHCCLIGSGAVIMPEVKIGNNCIIGAGSVVTKNVPHNSIVAGVPAKYIRPCK